MTYFAQEFLATFAQERWRTFAGIPTFLEPGVKVYGFSEA